MEKVGKYELREELGRGGMGVVYRAYDTVLDREVALKLILDSAMNVPEIRERFYREARTAGKLTHDNITVIHDVGEDQGRIFIVMEYLPGKDLRTILDHKESLSLDRKIDLALQIARGLAYSHSRNIIHRDIKPANIRVVDGCRVKIMDFGIAKPEASAVTSVGTVFGTPYYMSPEQVQGKPVDKRSDIFAFGVLLYELLTSRKPFTGNDPTAVMYNIVHGEPEHRELLDRTAPVALSRIVNRALQKNPDHRYQSFVDIVSSLEELSANVRHSAEVTPDARRNAGELLARAEQFYSRRNLPEALKTAEQALASDPDNSQAARVLADIRQAQQTEARQATLERHLATARQLFNSRRFPEAMQSAREILTLDPHHPEGTKLFASAKEHHAANLFREAENHRRRGHTAAAQRAARKALDLDPSHKGAEQMLRSLTQGKQRSLPTEALDPEQSSPARISGLEDSPARTRPRRALNKRTIAIAAFFLLAFGGVGAWRLLGTTPDGTGYVALNILPWAEVHAVRRLDGSRVPIAEGTLTPCRLELEPGAYEIQLTNPALQTGLVLQVTVKPGAVEEFSQKLPGFAYEAYLSTF